MPLFFKYEVDAATEGEKYGAKALGRCFEDAKKTYEENEELLLGEQQCFAIYDWLLDDVQRAASLDIIEKVYKQSIYLPVKNEFEPKKPRTSASPSSKGKVSAAKKLARVDTVSTLFG